MIDLILAITARFVPFVIGYFFWGAILAWLEKRGERRAMRACATSRGTGSPYRSAPAGQETMVDPREAWDAGAAAERTRVLTIVRAVREASKDGDVHRAADAIRDGVKAGPA